MRDERERERERKRRTREDNGRCDDGESTEDEIEGGKKEN
jgi:hypothetical protein